MNSYEWHNPRVQATKLGLFHVDDVTSLIERVEALTTRLNQMNKVQVNTITADFLP